MSLTDAFGSFVLMRCHLCKKMKQVFTRLNTKPTCFDCWQSIPKSD